MYIEHKFSTWKFVQNTDIECTNELFFTKINEFHTFLNFNSKYWLLFNNFAIWTSSSLGNGTNGQAHIIVFVYIRPNTGGHVSFAEGSLSE